MTRFAYLLAYFGLAVGLFLVFFGGLPLNPFATAINDFIVFLNSESVAQGLSWLAWFFPVDAVTAALPAFINALIVFFTIRGTLFILSLHA